MDFGYLHTTQLGLRVLALEAMAIRKILLEDTIGERHLNIFLPYVFYVVGPMVS